MYILNIPVLSEWLADALIQCSILLVIVLFVERLFKKMSAARRHVILMAGALGIPMIAVAAALMPAWQTSAAVEMEEMAAPVLIRREIQIGAGSVSVSTGDTQPGSAIPEKIVAIDWTGIALKIWAAGVAIFWLRLLLGILTLGRLRRRCRGTSHFDKILAEEAQLARTPAVVIGGEQSMPMTWGVLRHTILLPAKAEEWPESRVRRILRH